MVEVTIKPFQWQSGFARTCHCSRLSSRFDKCIGWKSLIHLGAYVWFFHNVQRETSKLCLLPAPYTLTLASLRLFELQRDCSLLLPHRHFVWIVISYRPLFSFPAFFLSLIASHSVAFSGWQLKHVDTCSAKNIQTSSIITGKTGTSSCYLTENRQFQQDLKMRRHTTTPR